MYEVQVPQCISSTGNDTNVSFFFRVYCFVDENFEIYIKSHFAKLSYDFKDQDTSDFWKIKLI